MANEENLQETKKKRRVIAGLLISTTLLGAIGFGTYHAFYNNGQQADKARVVVKNRKQNNVTKAKKQSTDTRDILSEEFDTKVFDNHTYGVSGVTVDDGLSSLSADLSSDKTARLVALADEAIKDEKADSILPPPIVDIPSTPIGGGETIPEGNGGGVIYDGAPTLSFSGPLRIHAGQKYVNLKSGVTATDVEDGNIIGNVIASGTVNTSTPGTYQVTYRVSDSYGHTVSATRPVIVSNDAPSIVFLGSNSVDVDSTFDPMSGMAARDFQDGDLKGSVKVEGTVDTSQPGEYTLTYKVKDSDGAETTKSRKIKVVAEKATIDVSKVQTSVDVDGSFDALKDVTAESKYGDVELTVTGKVDTAKPGEYKLEYKAVDKYDQETTVEVKVKVVAEKPTINTDKVETELHVGDTFDSMKDVTAKSKYGDAKVTVDGKVDTSAPGTYNLTYTATDKYGQEVVSIVTIHVNAEV